jgi:RNA polymerase sigma factor (sigma-70 family)
LAAGPGIVEAARMRRRLVQAYQQRLRASGLANLSEEEEELLGLLVFCTADELSDEVLVDNPQVWAFLGKNDMLLKSPVRPGRQTVEDLCSKNARRLSWQDIYEEADEWRGRAHYVLLTWAQKQREHLLALTPTSAKAELSQMRNLLTAIIRNRTHNEFRPDWEYRERRTLFDDMTYDRADGTHDMADIIADPRATSDPHCTEALARLRAALGELTALERDALLAEVEGQKQGEVARLHGVSQPAVSQALQRARKKLAT